MIGRFMRLLGRGKTFLGMAEPRFDFTAVGYPKTGNTWTRVMLGRYVQKAYDLKEMPLFDPQEMVDLRAGGYSSDESGFVCEPL